MAARECAFNEKRWNTEGFMEYDEYADCVTYVNQREYGDGQLEGDWFYPDADNLTIYRGTFGNDNAPGASMYTYAQRYDTREEFDAELAKWEAYPEYIDEDTNDDE